MEEEEGKIKGPLQTYLSARDFNVRLLGYHPNYWSDRTAFLAPRNHNCLADMQRLEKEHEKQR